MESDIAKLKGYRDTERKDSNFIGLALLFIQSALQSTIKPVEDKIEGVADFTLREGIHGLIITPCSIFILRDTLTNSK